MATTQTQLIPVMSRSFGSWQLRIEREPLTTESLAAQYDRAAPTWTRITNKYGYEASYRKIFREFFAGQPDGVPCRPIRVLDVGVGAGAYSLALLDAYRAPIDLTAVDISSAMLDETATRLAENGVHAQLCQADVRSLPFEPASFDLVIGAHVFEHLPDPVVAFADIKRVLRPGGWLVSCMTRQSWLGAYIQAKWRTHRVSKHRVVDWLQTAGLEATSHSPQPSGICRLTSLVAIAQKPAGNIEHLEHSQ